ncbi:hypothetical protein HK099_000611, partial [Clydaea vesicula]
MIFVRSQIFCFIIQIIFAQNLTNSIIPLQNCLASIEVIYQSSSSYSAAISQNCETITVFTYPRTNEEVVTVINCAKQSGRTVTARSGGHSYESYSLSSDIIIDLIHFDQLTIHKANLSATIGSGQWIGNVHWNLKQEKLLLPSGSCESVGIGGHAVSLIADGIIEMTLVTPQGEIKTVNKDLEPELFWALRGCGSGSFGIVTTFLMKVFPDEQGHSMVTYHFPSESAHRVLKQYSGHASLLPNNIHCLLYFEAVVGGVQALLITINRIGTLEEHKKDPAIINFLKLFPTPESTEEFFFTSQNDMIYEPEGKNRMEFLTNRNATHYSALEKTAGLLVDGELSDLAIFQIINGPWMQDPSLVGQPMFIIFENMGGKISTPETETCFIHRSPTLLSLELNFEWDAAFENEKRIDAINKWRHCVYQHTSQKVYNNYVWATADFASYYGDNLNRLVDLKKRVDPDNIFKFAISIPTDMKDINRVTTARDYQCSTFHNLLPDGEISSSAFSSSVPFKL